MWKFRTSDVVITMVIVGGMGFGYIVAGLTGMRYRLLFGAAVNAGYLLLRFVIIPLATRFIKYKNRFPSN
jgi:hypothetical protein